MFSAGICIGTTLAPTAAVCCVLLILWVLLFAILVTLARTHGPPPAARSLVAILLLAVSGAGGVLLDAEDHADGLPSSSPNIAVDCTIIDPPETSSRSLRLTVEMNSVRYGSVSRVASGTMLVTIIRDSSGFPPMPPYGSRIEVRGRLSHPPDTRNPGEVSLRRYFRIRGVDALMTCQGPEGIRLIDSTAGNSFFRYVVVPVRDYLLRNIDSTLGGEEGEFLKGLLIGVRSGLAPETRAAFVASGVAHILAVSGSNVAVVASALLFLFRLLRFPARWHFVPVTTALVMYMLVTGSQAPVVRATVMAVALLCARAVQRRTPNLNAVGIAGLIILGIDPLQLFDVGFQLSFAAVIALVVLYPRFLRLANTRWHLPRRARPLLQAAMVSVAAIVGTFPVSAIWFGEVSVVGVLANLAIVPASGASVVLGLVSAVIGLGSHSAASILGAANWVILHWTLELTRVLGRLSFATAGLHRFTLPDACAFYAFLLASFFSDVRGLVRLAIPVGLFSANISLLTQNGIEWNSRPAGLRVSVVDVGQGDAIVIEFCDGTVTVIDTGPSGSGYNAGERTISPLLKRIGIGRINLLIVTHDHADHAGGLDTILREFRVDEVWTPDTVRLLTASGIRTNIHHPREGERRIPAAGARLFVLSPGQSRQAHAIDGSAYSNSNNRSIVVKLVYGTTSFLFMGDAERVVEERIIKRYGPFLRSDVVKVAHHGGNTGTTDGFLDAVRPEFAILSVGRFNRHNHPSDGVLERIRRRGALVARTDSDGAVILETDGATLRRVIWRDEPAIPHR